MEHLSHALACLGKANGIGVAVVCGSKRESIFGVNESNPLFTSPSLCRNLIERSEQQEEPVIYHDSFGVFFCCISSGDLHYLFGPFPGKNMDVSEMQEYFRYYAVKRENRRLVRSFLPAQILAVTALAAEIITGKEYSEQALSEANHLIMANDEALLRDRIHHYIRDEERELYHHTYTEELSILGSVKEGNVQEVLSKSLAADEGMGRLSRDELTHWKYAAVVAITLCARAAVQGGVFPAAAYHYSDFFIRKLDDCRDVASVIALRNRAVCTLTEQVNQAKPAKVNEYVDQCVDYIVKHYREKIRLEDIARQLGLSVNYLSKIFYKYTGKHFQDYVLQHRVERSVGLLSHSDMNLTDIAIYVGFPSQSYFGRVFKKTMGITPRQYRETHRLREFTESADNQ